MPRFRKRPVVIEATQWFPGICVCGVVDYNDTGVEKQLVTPGGLLFTVPPGCGHMEELEGQHIVTPGDWIITGIHGEKYACKPDIFEKTYELVED